MALLKAGANVNANASSANDHGLEALGKTALHFASKKEIVAVLLNARADIKATDKVPTLCIAFSLLVLVIMWAGLGKHGL